MHRKSSLTRLLTGVRFRILVWYILLTTCLIFVSYRTSRKIFFWQLKHQIYASLEQEVERLKTLVSHKKNPVQIPEEARSQRLYDWFDEFIEDYVPLNHVFLITAVNGKVYRSSSTHLPKYIEENPDVLLNWANHTEAIAPQLFKRPNCKLIFTVKPIRLHQNASGTLIVVHDTRTAFQVYKSASTQVIHVTLTIFIVFSSVAWITAGRVLAPLRLLTKTALSITESDMTQRISIKGTDEIAELGSTFNEMLDRLQAAFDSQKAFINNAGHELRTPITVIQGHLELLQFKPERLEKTLPLVMDELDRMNRLVNDLLLLAKAESPNFLNLKLEELDWLTEELYLKAKAIAPRNWQLESKGLSPIKVDRQRLTQAVMNLVANAVRHTKIDDTIALGSTLQENYAYFWVRDTGEGIAPQDQQRIFERFVRATDADRYSEGEGVGLGLSIVEAIAIAHGGWVELDSTLGQGSTFTLVFPLEPTSQHDSYEPYSHRRGQLPHQRISRSRITSPWVHDSDR